MAAALSAAPRAISAQSVSEPGAALRVVVRGVVFDSLTMEAVPNAAVWLQGGTQTTRTDGNGRFELDDVPSGRQFLAFSAPAFDSLGLGVLGSAVDVAGNVTQVRLTTPSFRTVWKSLCTNDARVGSDSGIVWGTVRDATTELRQSGAAAAFSWYELTLNAAKRFDFSERIAEVRTDSTGIFYACGLPTDIKIATEARGSRAASGAIEYVVGPRRLHRVDLLVSTDMVLQEITGTTREDSLAALRAHGTAMLRGRVVDSKGKDVAGASITLASVDTVVRTNALGEFTMLALPSGTHALQARSVGFTAATALVDLHPDQLTQITLELPDAQALAVYNVRADRIAGIDQQEFNYRKKTGMGYTLAGNQLNQQSDVTSMMRAFPALTVTRNRGQFTVTMSNRRGGQCTPMVYIDKIRSTSDEADIYRPEDYAAVEVYNSEFTVPIGYASNNCGAILLWTKKNSRW